MLDGKETKKKNIQWYKVPTSWYYPFFFSTLYPDSKLRDTGFLGVLGEIRKQNVSNDGGSKTDLREHTVLLVL